MQRICFSHLIKMDRMDQYEEAHKHVWPEVLEALTKAGWKNYSIFLNRKDGCLVTYFEVENFQLALDAIAADPISLKWQSEMVDFFVPVPGKSPANAFEDLVEVFHLD